MSPKDLRISFVPGGLVFTCELTHGLRRGLRSFALSGLSQSFVPGRRFPGDSGLRTRDSY